MSPVAPQSVNIKIVAPLSTVSFPFWRLRHRRLLLGLMAAVLLFGWVVTAFRFPQLRSLLGALIAASGFYLYFCSYLINWRRRPDAWTILAIVNERLTVGLATKTAERTLSINPAEALCEPVVYPITAFSRRPHLSLLATRHGRAALFLSIIGIQAGGQYRTVLMFALILIFLLLTRGCALLRPTYYRISPGYLETLTGWFWSTRLHRAQVISLSNRRIHLDLASGLIFIANDNGEADLLGIAGVSNFSRMKAPLFAAALADNAVLLTPADRLVG